MWNMYVSYNIISDSWTGVGQEAHLATMGVSPTVMGARTGMVALLQMKAMRKAELPSLSFLRNQLCSPSCSLLSSFAANRCSPKHSLIQRLKFHLASSFSNAHLLDMTDRWGMGKLYFRVYKRTDACAWVHACGWVRGGGFIIVPLNHVNLQDKSTNKNYWDHIEQDSFYNQKISNLSLCIPVRGGPNCDDAPAKRW